MNVREIVIAHLKDGGFDGLAGEDCGCGLDDLMPCGWERDVSVCKPARKVNCKQDGFTYCEGCIAVCNEAERQSAEIYIPAESDQHNEEETHL